MQSDLPFSDWEISPDGEAGDCSGYKSGSRLHCFTDGSIPRAEIQIAKRPDGSDWELGSGGFGMVYRGLRNGVQPVAVKVLSVSVSSLH